MCTNASFTAASLLGFSTAADRTGALTYTADTLNLHDYEFMKWDMGTAVNPKAFIISGLRNTAFKISSTATVKLQGSTTDSWTSPEYEYTLTYNEFGMSVFGLTGLHTSALRYWRLYISDPTNIYGYVEISNIYLGDVVVTSQGAVQFPLNTSLQEIGQRTLSRSGVALFDKIQVTEVIDFEWALLNKTDKDTLEDFVRDVGMSTPFFVALDPNEVFSGELERHVRYVRFDSGPSFSLIAPNVFSSSWTLREEL
jgi:hypothetical protein